MNVLRNFAQPDITPRERLIIALLLASTDEDGWARVPQSSMADALECDAATVANDIDHLRGIGMLTMRGVKSGIYALRVNREPIHGEDVLHTMESLTEAVWNTIFSAPKNANGWVDTMTQLDIAAAFFVSEATINRVILDLEKVKRIERHPDDMAGIGARPMRVRALLSFTTSEDAFAARFANIERRLTDIEAYLTSSGLRLQ